MKIVKHKKTLVAGSIWMTLWFVQLFIQVDTSVIWDFVVEGNLIIGWAGASFVMVGGLID